LQKNSGNALPKSSGNALSRNLSKQLDDINIMVTNGSVSRNSGFADPPDIKDSGESPKQKKYPAPSPFAELAASHQFAGTQTSPMLLSPLLRPEGVARSIQVPSLRQDSAMSLPMNSGPYTQYGP